MERFDSFPKTSLRNIPLRFSTSDLLFLCKQLTTEELVNEY